MTRVLDTHVHADHLSRSRNLAELTGASLHLAEGAPVSYPHSAIGDGGRVKIGASRLEAVPTPEHTAEGACYLLDERALFTGDTLFLSAMGRPDLEATTEQAKKTRMLYRSLKRLLDLPPSKVAPPGDVPEPVSFGGELAAGALTEVARDIRMLHEGEEAFVEKVAGGVSPTPTSAS